MWAEYWLLDDVNKRFIDSFSDKDKVIKACNKKGYSVMAVTACDTMDGVEYYDHEIIFKA